MKSKIISFWSPVSRSGCSTNAALYISYLSKVMNEMEKAVLFSLNTDVDSTDYITDSIIKEGLKKLKLLYENGEVNSKEDIYVYTHKIAENIDVLGTEKNTEEITSENLKLMLDILSKAYDYIILDISSGINYLDAIDCSTVLVACIPQDKYIAENYSDGYLIYTDKKNIILLSDYDNKKAVKKSDIEVILQRETYTISHDVKINKACDERDVYSYVRNKKSNNAELDRVYKEIERLINNDNLNVNYTLKSNSRQRVNKVVKKDGDIEETTKIVKEYKFIKARSNIGVINLSKGAGATFLTLNLACFLKEKKLNVAVAEIPFSKKAKQDIYNIINYDDFEEELPFVVDGIKYYINTHRLHNYSDMNIENQINAINREKNSINLYDLGYVDFHDNNINYLLNLLDCCIIVIEPLPFKLLQSNSNYEMLINELKASGVEVIHVVNKFIDDLNKKDIENYFDCKVISCIPFLRPETIYTAHYSYKAAYKIEKNQILKDSFERIIDIANIAVNLEEKRKGIFNIFKIFKKRKEIR